MGTENEGGVAESAPVVSVAIAGVQLILAEKRTALAVMRTGITVFALPLGVLSLLITTSRYYSVSETLHLVVPLIALCSGLVGLGTYLIYRSLRRIHHHDELIRKLKAEHGELRRFID